MADFDILNIVQLLQHSSLYYNFRVVNLVSKQQICRCPPHLPLLKKIETSFFIVFSIRYLLVSKTSSAECYFNIYVDISPRLPTPGLTIILQIFLPQSELVGVEIDCISSVFNTKLRHLSVINVLSLILNLVLQTDENKSICSITKLIIKRFRQSVVKTAIKFPPSQHGIFFKRWGGVGLPDGILVSFRARNANTVQMH